MGYTNKKTDEDNPRVSSAREGKEKKETSGGEENDGKLPERERERERGRRGKSSRGVSREDKDGQTTAKERKEERNGCGLKRAEGLKWLLAPGSLLRSPRYSLEHCQASARAQDCHSVHDSRSRERHERAGYEPSSCTKRRISKDFNYARFSFTDE